MTQRQTYVQSGGRKQGGRPLAELSTGLAFPTADSPHAVSDGMK